MAEGVCTRYQLLIRLNVRVFVPDGTRKVLDGRCDLNAVLDRLADVEHGQRPHDRDVDARLCEVYTFSPVISTLLDLV